MSISELIQDKNHPEDWRVECIDSRSGNVFVTIFCGSSAKERATEYAVFKSRDVMEGLYGALEYVTELLRFHDGTAEREFSEAEPTIRVNGEDWKAALTRAEAALAAAAPHLEAK